MATSKTIITELDVPQLQTLQAQMTKQVLVIKFGAEWCGPCKKIAPNFQDYIAKAPENVIFADIDVDDNIDLYIALKKNKIFSALFLKNAFGRNSPNIKITKVPINVSNIKWMY